MTAPILTINSGSSSLKFGLYLNPGAAPRPLYSGTADGIGKDHPGTLTLKDASGKQLFHRETAFPSQNEAFAQAAEQLEALSGTKPAAIGHRIVHGGPHLREHQLITAEVLATLEASTHFAPLHIPPALALIRLAGEHYPGVPQFACFDTAFHATMSPAAFTYAIPAKYRVQGVQRYGFHGLSYESIVRALEPDVPARLVVAHLGNGASLCAIECGRSVDTSMGFTPSGGIPMGTRTGDLDPGVPLFLQRQDALSTDALETLINHDSGLKALSSGIKSDGSSSFSGSSDMRTLTASAFPENSGPDHSASGNPAAQAAALAIDIFCRSIAKTIGAYCTVLGGLDLLVFTGGIGEHSTRVREGVCSRLAFLGLTLDRARNEQAADTISANDSRIPVRILPADEDGQIARHVHTMLSS